MSTTQSHQHTLTAPASTTNLHIQQSLQAMLDGINHIVLDKAEVVKLAVTCLLANGHLLLQDLPGMGKTTLAHAIANHLGLSFNRVQFTSDMLPADILGLSLYKTDTGEFEHREGPIFCHLLLADEINRSSPKTQSALLEAMEERQVSQDGVTRQLPSPFFVIATQNPMQQAGVYPLPESQLDRFLMCLSLGYPSAQAERDLLLGIDRRQLLSEVNAVLSIQTLQQVQQAIKQVHIAPPVLDYIQRLVAKSRHASDYHGLSTRGVIALKMAAQAYAYVSGYQEVSPEDVQAVFVAVVDHRLGQGFVPFDALQGAHHETAAHKILDSVAVIV